MHDFHWANNHEIFIAANHDVSRKLIDEVQVILELCNPYIAKNSQAFKIHRVEQENAQHEGRPEHAVLVAFVNKMVIATGICHL